MVKITGKFLKVQCTKCNNEQNIYSKPSTEVKCLVCDETLAMRTGGTAKMSEKAKVLKVLD